MIYLLNDHKSGHTLTNKLIKILNNHTTLAIQRKVFYLFWNIYKKEHKYIILVRNPKEIIISGYLYHKKCTEKWAVTYNGNYYDYWKDKYFMKDEVKKNKKYLELAKKFSIPICYKKKLNNLSQTSGIIMEMKSVAQLTITGMYQLQHYDKKNTFILKYEDLVFKHDETIKKLCNFLDIDINIIQLIINESGKHNIINLKKKNITLNHSTNKNIKENRYLEYWNKEIQEEFEKIYPKDIMQKFGYV